MTKYNHICC